MTVLNSQQLDCLIRIEDKARALAYAKLVVREATEAVQSEASKALEAGVPISRIAVAAGVERSLVYHWKRGGAI